MTRVVDKRNVLIVTKASEDGDSKIYLFKRGKDLSLLIYGKYDESIAIATGSQPVSRLTTPDMLAIVNASHPAGNANVKAKFNGVEVPATEFDIGGDNYKVWGLKSQDFVEFDFSGTTA